MHDVESALRFHEENAHFTLQEASQKNYVLTLRYPCEKAVQHHITLAEQVTRRAQTERERERERKRERERERNREKGVEK